MDLNALPASKATEVLTACCGSSRWVAKMVASRPFPSREAVLQEADRIWASLVPRDWLEAFMHHPRIGEKAAAVVQDRTATSWSAEEQGDVERAAADVRAELARVNRDYEQRFGFIYVVRASGKSAAEMLDIARERLRNDPELELRVAAEEQRKIMQLRLEKLLDSPEIT
jgi:OHCU decarboxylase